MMRDQIKFGMVRTNEEYEDLKKFAKSFGHNVGNDTVLPIYVIERGDQVIGFFNMIPYPIGCPSFHPKVCTPRDFHEAALSLKNHFCLQSMDGRYPNGTCLLALPKNPEMGERAIQRVGFKQIGREIWQYIP
jgi:hypothetical protein